MTRPKDIAWNFVIRPKEGKKWCCPYCKNEYSGSVTRVKGHFLKQPKEGIASCTKVPEHIRTLMELLLNNEVHDKEDIAWKFVNRLEDNKWKCRYCSVEFSGDLTGVKGHLLKVPIEGINICTEVPDHIRKLMQSLLDEVAEEDSRGANGQSSMEPQSRQVPAQAEAGEHESREANGESSTVSQSRDMPTQVEVAQEESRDANSQSFIEQPQWRPLSPDFFQLIHLEQMVSQPLTGIDIEVNSDQQSQAERQSHESSAMPLSAQISHALVYPQHQSVTHQSETRNVLQNPTALTSTALMDMDSCIPSSSQAPNKAPHGPTGISNFNQQYVTGLYSGQQSQAERQFPQSSTMPSLVQNSHGDSTSCSTDALAEGLSYLLASPGNSNCSQDCNKHSQFQTPMDIDPSIASQHTTDSHAIGTTIVDLQVPEVATNTIGPSSSQDMNKGSPIMNVRRTPQTCRRMEQMVQEARAVDIANLPLDGATSYSSASSLPNSFFPNSLTLNAQQNPSALLPLQNRQLLDNTSQNESQRSILSGLDASDALLTNMVTTNTPQHFNQSDQTFHGQCGCGTGLSPPQASMDIEPPIPSQPFNGPPFTGPFNSPPQVPGIINTAGPSTLAVQPDLVPPQHQNVPHQSETRNVLQNPTAPSSQAPNNAPPGTTEISNFNQQNIIGPHADQQSQAERESTSCSTEASGENVLYLLASPHQPPWSFPSPCPEEMPTNGQQIPTGSSSFQYNQLPATGDSHCFLDCNQHSQLQTITSRHTSDPPIVEATIDDSQVPKAATNTIGPSSSQDMNRCSPTMNLRSIYANDEEIRNLKRKVEELDDKEAVIKEEMELESAASSVRKKPRILVERWLKETERARNNFQIIGQANAETLPPKQQVETLTRRVEELIGKTLPQPLLIEERDAKGVKLLERKLTGKAIHRNIELIWDHLTKNHGCKLGIYGMGGVGKTTIMMHIHNRLLEDATFDGVVFITVSKDFSIYKLQSNIGKALKCGVMEDEDEKKRAAMLSKHLESKKNCVLILDDVWEHLDLDEVGIPFRAYGFKLVLTTRSFSVCHQMQCQEKIKIEPLSQEEAESLFLEELGCEVPLHLEIEAIVKSVVKECAGLPIGVITMARSMRGVTDVFQWRDFLVKLKESSMGQVDMEKKVLMNLKFSYDRLGNLDVQQCFLSCALYPEDELIDKFELVEFFIDQGLIGGLNTRNEQYDRGFTILNELRNACLLEDGRGIWIKMHDLIRDMALYIMSATSIVKAGKQLRNIPPEEYWTDALEKVSLMKNDISEFSLNLSPNCPKLSTLLLNYGLGDVVIPNSFFKNLCGLKVLDLRGNWMTELPNSISNLVNLRALLLGGCWELRRIPYLGKLTSLRKLDVGGECGLEEVPEGLEMLVNLRYLEIFVELPERVLGGLLNLQHLKVDFLDGQDMTKLRALETLECSFKDANNFNKCVRVIEQSNPLCYYHLRMVQKDIYWESDDEVTQFENPKRIVNIWGWDHAIVSVGGECTGIFILIPQDVRQMTIRECDGIINLSSMGPLEYLENLEIAESKNLGVLYGGQDEEVIDILAPALAPLLFSSLRVLKIYKCPKLKYLFGHVFKSNLPHLREIRIWRCEEMVGIIATVTSPPPHPLPFFPSLENIVVFFCNKMKRAVESEWMPHFPTLRSIEVRKCEQMEEMIGGPPPYLPVEDISLKSLIASDCDNMRKLFPHEWLLHLRNLQGIHVHSCKRMVEMISGVGQGQEGSITTPVYNTPPSFQPSSISLPKLEKLVLDDLPQLKSICEVPISCDSMEELIVYKCPELKGIPLQLRLREIEELPHIWVEDEKKWKMLMWDHLDAQAILRPYLRKGEHANKKSIIWWERWSSPNAIELSTKGKDLQRLYS